MISDIPAPSDFGSVGIHMLNLAWDTAASLLCDIDEAGYFEIDTDEVKDAFWLAARVQLSTALAIAQQGSEFLLKGKIAHVSPYLLLGAQPRDWPSGCASKTVPFSDFRTIDAQDLIKVHNTTCSPTLSQEFSEKFEDLRRKRNAVLHSIDKNLSVHVYDLILAVLFINESLGTEKNWAKVRHEHLKNSPLSQMHSEDYADHRLVWEFSIIRDLLKPADLKKYFKFDSKSRSYICPNCAYSLARDAGHQPKTAMLKPNTPDSEVIWCFVCDEKQEVDRDDCDNGDCKGNVISLEHGRCLTCGGSVG
jgi:hypothetical protein